jgi:hypothetical protein
MSREKTFGPWAVPGALLLLTVVYILISRVERREMAALQNTNLQWGDACTKSLKSLQTQTLQALGRVEGLERRILDELQLLQGEMENGSGPGGERIVEGTEGAPEEAIPADGDLPPLPQDVDPLILKSLSVHDLVRDRRLNPDNKQPNRLTTARIYGALLFGKQELERIEHRRQVGVIEAADALDANGECVHYGLGETPVPAGSGTLTAGVPTADGTKVFYLTRERFQNIYGLNEEEKATAALYLRRAMNHLRE